MQTSDVSNVHSNIMMIAYIDMTSFPITSVFTYRQIRIVRTDRIFISLD